MFVFTIIIGLYSYAILFLGLLHLLYKQVIFATTIIFLLLSFIFFKKGSHLFKFIAPNNILSKLLLVIFLAQLVINFIGSLGPELGFDALWYHLTLPKIYLLNHAVIPIPGGLLYYSEMPRLAEMLYTAALSFGTEQIPKIIQLLFGLFTSIAIFKIAKKHTNKNLAFLALVIFYSNLVVDWESITAYIDLARTFFEIMALWGFIEWFDRRKKRWFIFSAITLGFAIGTKLLALTSLIIFSVMIVIVSIKNKQRVRSLFNSLFVYWLICFVISFPWFILSFIHTGNPVYPFFSDLYKTGLSANVINPIKFLSDIWTLFVHADDPISPVYIITVPFLFLNFKKFSTQLKLITYYSLIAIFIWYITPRTGGGRFILPYLPAFSLVVIGAISKERNEIYRKCIILVIIFISLTSIVYRGIANKKYFPVIFGKESKQEFLTKNLNFSFGDYYDTDSYFKNHIKESDTVLLYGFHNLYYIDFPFIDSSWVKKGDRFNYIALQQGDLPKQYRKWQLIYKNDTTNVKLFSLDNKKWIY